MRGTRTWGVWNLDGGDVRMRRFWKLGQWVLWSDVLLRGSCGWLRTLEHAPVGMDSPHDSRTRLWQIGLKAKKVDFRF